jgi:hypothetical protein
MKEKEFGKLSKQQLRSFYAQYYSLDHTIEDFDNLLKEKSDNFLTVFKLMPPWSGYYELEFSNLIGLFILAAGLSERVHACAKENDPQQAFLDYLDSNPDFPIPEDDLTDEMKGQFMACLFAITNNIMSLRIHSLTLNELVARAREDDDESIFKAVLIDRSVVGTPTVLKRIALAQIMNDESFMNQLTKAITRTKPRRPLKEYDDLRYMFEVIDESIGIENLTHDKLYDLLVVDLELYPNEFSSFSELLKDRNRKVKKTK